MDTVYVVVEYIFYGVLYMALIGSIIAIIVIVRTIALEHKYRRNRRT